MTPKELEVAINAYTVKHKKTPTPKELLEVLGSAFDPADKKKLNPALARYKAKMTRLTIIDGRVYSDAGKTIWHQSSAGSMMPARYYDDKGQGALITH